MSNTARVLAPNVELQLSGGRTLAGRLEHFPAGKSLVIFDENELAPTQLTVLAAEAPGAHAALEDDQVLLRNWTDARGAAEALAGQGVIELTGEEVKVGMFGLQALVARVL